MKYLSNTVLITFISTCLFADTPDWTFNLNDYEVNSGVTAIVFIDNVIQEVADDLLAAFAPDGSVRGLASPSGPLPFGPYAGTNHYLLSVYGDNEESDSTFTFKYYSASNGQVIDLAGTITFDPPNPVGSVTDPFMLNNGTADTSDWSFNVNDYEVNSGVTAIVSIDNVVQEGADDLLIAFAPDGSVRGVSSPSGALPFGPFQDTNHYLDLIGYQ